MKLDQWHIWALLGVVFIVIGLVLWKWNKKIEGFNNKIDFIIDNPYEKIITDKKYTAIIVEPRKHKALDFVLTNFMQNLNDDWGFMIFHSNDNKQFVENIINNSLTKYKNKTTLVNLNVDSNNFTVKEYSTMFFHKNFYNYIPTETFLIFQTDSIILKENKNKINNFLKYDYVGAPWPKTMGLHGKMEVGNGGLSLRKKSKMLELLKYKKLGIDNILQNKYGKYIAEDMFFNGYNVKEVNVLKPSFDEAKSFSIEAVYSETPFGVHKCWSGLEKDKYEYLKTKYPDIQTLEDLNTDNRIAIITAIYGNYDNIKEHNIHMKDKVDWYCFTNNVNMKSNLWNIINTPYHIHDIQDSTYRKYKNYYDKNKKTKNMMAAKYYKIKSHKIDILKKYDYIVWIDGSIFLQNNFINNIQTLINKKYQLINFKHSIRTNIKDEVIVSKKIFKYINQDLDNQYKTYIKEGFQDNNGLFENTIIIRKNNSNIEKLFDEWWIHNLKYSYQDQISYPFVLWKNKMNPDYIINDNVFNNKDYSYVDYNMMKKH